MSGNAANRSVSDEYMAKEVEKQGIPVLLPAACALTADK